MQLAEVEQALFTRLVKWTRAEHARGRGRSGRRNRAAQDQSGARQAPDRGRIAGDHPAAAERAPGLAIGGVLNAHRPKLPAACLGVALALTTVAGKPARSAVFNPETFTLDNGMQVVVVTNRRAPVVSHHVWYKVGSADSPYGKSGLRALPRASHVQGHRESGARRVLAHRRAQRRQRERVHRPRLHRLLPDHRQGSPRAGHADGGRPHDQPAARRAGSAERAQRRARGALAAGRQRSGRAPERAAERDPVLPSSVPHSGDRLAARDRELHAARTRSPSTTPGTRPTMRC